MQEFQLLYPLSYLLILIGLIFAVVPVLPGAVFIWLGVYVWADASSFKVIGWPTLVVLGLMMVVAWGSDLLLTVLIARRSGASRRAILGAIIGGVLGGIFLTGLLPIPVLGTIVGGIAGSLVGIIVVELLTRRSLGAALRSAGGHILGYFASVALQLTLCLLMVGIFAFQAFVLH